MFNERTDIVYFHIVCVVKIVAKIIFREIEWDEETCFVRRETRCADQCDGEFRPSDSLAIRMNVRDGDC